MVRDLSNGEIQVLAYKKQINNQGNKRGIPFCNFLFTRKGINFAKKALTKPSDLLIIDEFGPLELSGKGITNALAAFASEQNTNAILIVRKELIETVLTLLKCDGEIIEVTQKNRDRLPDLTLEKLLRNNRYEKNES
jgi:nucleoside-triphosphatase THEP1